MSVPLESIEGFGVRCDSDCSHSEPFQDLFGLQGEAMLAGGCEYIRLSLSSVQMGLLPESRGVVVLCGSQAGGWAHRAVLEA